jgi:hypothetical protein
MTIFTGPFSDKTNKDYPGNAYGTYYVIFILMGRTSSGWMKLGFYMCLGWKLRLDPAQMVM